VDALGSTIGYVNSSGALAGSYTYQPFGKTTPSGTNASTFQFTGRENDGTGLYYYRARYYSSLYQRFIAEDPLDSVRDGTGSYAYVRNDPIRFERPYGKTSDCHPCADLHSRPRSLRDCGGGRAWRSYRLSCSKVMPR
jgi:RHS repeat-associated protein